MARLWRQCSTSTCWQGACWSVPGSWWPWCVLVSLKVPWLLALASWVQEQGRPLASQEQVGRAGLRKRRRRRRRKKRRKKRRSSRRSRSGCAPVRSSSHPGLSSLSRVAPGARKVHVHLGQSAVPWAPARCCRDAISSSSSWVRATHLVRDPLQVGLLSLGSTKTATVPACCFCA